MLGGVWVRNDKKLGFWGFFGGEGWIFEGLVGDGRGLGG